MPDNANLSSSDSNNTNHKDNHKDSDDNDSHEPLSEQPPINNNGELIPASGNNYQITTINGHQAPESKIDRNSDESNSFSLLGIFKQFLGIDEEQNDNNIDIRYHIEEFITKSQQGNAQKLHAEEQFMLKNILFLSQLTVADVMIPRSDIVAISIDSNIESLRETLLESAHTRMPVYRDNLDHIQGFIHIKDLVFFLGNDEEFIINNILREILVVPDSMRIIDLLVKMRKSAVHMAIVVDEYGGTDGLVTLEDIFEEIVGEINDEHDESEQLLHHHKDGSFEADAKIRIEEIEQQFGITLRDEDEDFDSLGGLIFCRMGKVPQIGEEMIVSDTGKSDNPNGNGNSSDNGKANGKNTPAETKPQASLKLKIIAADARRIHQIMIEKM